MNTATKLMLGLLGGRRAFSPLEIPGLALWLDASDSTTLFQDSDGTTPATADNDVVGYWGDKSGNGYHATQATTANKPVLKLAQQNSRNALLFNGSSNFLSIASFALSSFAILAVTKNSTNAVLMEQSVNASANDGFYVYSNNSGSLTVRRGGTAHNTTAGVDWGNSGATILWSAEFTGPYANTLLKVNGSAIGSGTGADLTASTVTDALYIGSRAGTGFFLNGNYMEIIAYSPHPGAAAFTQITAYLNTKWAVY